MASNADEMPDMLQCPICLEQYETPRALPCLHTFCEKCLVDWMKHKSVMNTLTIGSQRCFPCPVCKDDVHIPPEGIKGFRHNFFIANVIEPTSPCRKLPPREISDNDIDKSIACSRCEEVGVSMICLKCNHWLCPLCCDDHRRVKGTKTHILASNTELVDANINTEITDQDLSICDESGHDKLKSIYCTVCKILVCDECQKVNHNSHGSISIVCKFEEIRNELIDCMTRLQKRTEVLQRQQASLATAKKDLISHGHKTVRDFDKSFAAIQKKMQTMRSNLQKNLKKHITEQVTNLDERISGINDKLAIEQSVQEEMKAVLESGNKKNLLTQSRMLSEQGEQCLSTHLINLDNTLTISSPSWKACEADLFDQLLVKLIGGCNYTGIEVNLNKKLKSTRKIKRSNSSSKNKEINKEVDDKIQLDQLQPPTDDNLSNQLCDIIRDFDPYSPADQPVASHRTEVVIQHQQTTDSSSDPNTSDDLAAYYDYHHYSNYAIDDDRDGSFDTESPPSDLEGEQHITSDAASADVPQTGPFYENVSTPDMSQYWWPPPPPTHFHGPPSAPPPPHWVVRGRGGSPPVGFHSPPPPPHHHPPPPPFYGSPTHRPGHPHHHHRGRGHRHKHGKRGGHH